MATNDEYLVKLAVEATKKVRSLAESRDDWKYIGYVGAALITSDRNIFTGVNISLSCGIGFCAEHSAIAEMVKNGETRIEIIVAATTEGEILPPCGRCREMIYQIDPDNLGTEVVVDQENKRTLRELLPHNWQEKLGSPLTDL